MIIDPAGLDWKRSHEFFVSAVVPRPIAFVSTVGPDGIYNLAPYSDFALMSSKPPIVGFGVARKRDLGKKDTLVNVEFTKDFVLNIVTESLAEAMNQTAGEYPSHVDEFRVAALTAVKSDLVRSPRVEESPVNLECRLLQILEFGQAATRISNFIVGEVVRVHIQEEVWVDNVINAHKLKAVARLGGDFYCRTTDTFEMKRPEVPGK
jgi:flavin reductase (DIM6/NTAB) family NADH-FMN oxidoreductase RutF